MKDSSINNNNRETCTRMVTFNCKSIKRSIDGVRMLCRSADIVALQETWLFPHDLHFLGTVDEDFGSTGTSAIDTGAGLIAGRPFGGVALLWRSSVFPCVSVVECSNPRICAIKISLSNKSVVVCSVYMPTDSRENLAEFTDCLSALSAIIDECAVESVFMLGDYNAHPCELFYSELEHFCSEQSWICADTRKLQISPQSFTFVSDAHGSRRWLDHCVVTEAAWQCISSISIIYDMYWSDHLPLTINCNLHLTLGKVNFNKIVINKIKWGNRNKQQTDCYFNICNDQLKHVILPNECEDCFKKICHNKSHRSIIDKLYDSLITILSKAATVSYDIKGDKSSARFPHRLRGWNIHVNDAHREARSKFLMWVWYGKPNSGTLYNEMVNSRKIFKSRLKWCQNHQEQIKMDALASHHSKGDFSKFWKSTNKLSSGPGLTAVIDGVGEPQTIANLFKDLFSVQSSQKLSVGVPDAEINLKYINTLVNAKTVTKIIQSMTRGKSPGHDSLSIEHLQHAGPRLAELIAFLFNLCIVHSYLPLNLMRTVVVPIVKK